MTIHDEIDNYLAADLHNELSDEERNALHSHLVECADCRQAHQETKVMNKVLEEKCENAKPDVAFENRMLAAFRNRIPDRAGSFGGLLFNLLHSRATQLAGVAALLLALVQVGRIMTGEHLFGGRGESFALEQSVAPMEAQDREADLAKSDGGRAKANGFRALSDSRDATVAAPPPPATATGGLARPEVAHLYEEKALASTKERVVVTGSDTPTPEEVAQNPVDAYRRDDTASTTATSPALANRKLTRNATVDLEIVSFDQARSEDHRVCG